MLVLAMSIAMVAFSYHDGTVSTATDDPIDFSRQAMTYCWWTGGMNGFIGHKGGTRNSRRTRSRTLLAHNTLFKLANLVSNQQKVNSSVYSEQSKYEWRTDDTESQSVRQDQITDTLSDCASQREGFLVTSPAHLLKPQSQPQPLLLVFWLLVFAPAIVARATRDNVSSSRSWNPIHQQ